MAKKKKEEKEKKKETKKEAGKKESSALDKLPPEVKEKLKAIKEKLDKFQKAIIEKFEQYIVGISLLPPPKTHKAESEEEKKKLQEMKDKFHVLVLIDDSEPTKMSKAELKNKISAILSATAKEIDPKIVPQTLLLSELWQNCYDQKYELLKVIALSAPIYDTGMLSAIKIAEIHKSMVLKKFEKYIVAYVLAGSLVQGKATKDSDIDVFLVIDDTDVKKMTRTELRDKLRAIIIGMGIEAGEITGIRNKLNIQVYILTDFWESVREANPVIFTFLRDGVPFYDRGIFMPWKQLLKMGKIKPSPEAIDMYLSSGEQMLSRVKNKLRDIGTEDFFWSILTPSQAALMMYGVPPPTPKEAPGLMREIFVKKEGLLEDNFVKILENVIQTRKDFEHGKRKEITGKEIDKLLDDCEKYMKRLKRLFTQIEKVKEEETMVKIYDGVQTALRDVLKLEGVEKVKESDIIKVFEEKLINAGKVPAKFLRTLKDITKAKADYDAGKLTKTEVGQAKKTVGELIKFLVEYMQRKRMKDLERVKLRIKRGEKIGEVVLLGNTAFITLDVTDKKMQKAEIKSDGSLGALTKCSPEEFEKALAKIAVTQKVILREPLFESLKKIFGKDYELII
ncbi:hypothetical protein B6U93_02860 [Candidatus Woesearchaeota archaeon ex4484_78]|nr:MAG: hypothetical protein B6U93_02860 [Candidatus Woesearchaeota archaeon ex4484_78]